MKYIVYRYIQVLLQLTPTVRLWDYDIRTDHMLIFRIDSYDKVYFAYRVYAVICIAKITLHLIFRNHKSYIYDISRLCVVS